MSIRIPLAAFGLASLLAASSFAADDVEVLAKGPVHEAYADPSEREPTATTVIPKEPPKVIEELPPDQKPDGDNVQWMPGYWAYDEDKKDFLWVSGFWRNMPPGRTWVQGSWRKAADGWQWSGGFWAEPKKGDEKKADIEYLPQPPAPLDNAGPTTPAPTEKHIYAPGTWVYRDRYVWRPGFWYEYRPDWVWTPAHYRWTPAGYVFIDGYWDYPLATRGILFAPAYIPASVYAVPAYVYTPTIVVRHECLFGAFFCRRGYGAYYFGDYFAPSYASVGFVAWSGHVSASITIGAWHDPLFAYYHCGYRSDPYWRAGVFDLYAGRYRGDYARPPVTLVQQKTVINNITKNTTINNVNTNNVTMLTSLKDANTTSRTPLRTVPASERLAQQQQAKSLRATGESRGTMETTLAAKPGSGGRTGAPRSGTLDVVGPPVKSKGAVISKDPGVATTTGNPPLAPKPATLGKKDAVIGTPKHDPATLGQPDGLKGKPPAGTKPIPLSKNPRISDDPKPSTGTPPKLGPQLAPRPAPKSSPPPKSDPPAKKGKTDSVFRGQMPNTAPLSAYSASNMKPPVRTPPATIPKPPARLPQPLRAQVTPTRVPPAVISGSAKSTTKSTTKSSASKPKPRAMQLSQPIPRSTAKSFVTTSTKAKAKAKPVVTKSKRK